jgi:Phage tail assembly chaperone proteins, E, or 41 or 14
MNTALDTRNGHATSGEISEDAFPRTKDIEIDPPLDVNGKTYSTLHLEEPTARMVERAEGELSGTMTVHTLRKYQISLVSNGAGVPRAVIEQMRISQVREAADFLSSFIGAGLPTGES